MYVALVTNDDGIDSIGIRALAKELSELGFKVYVSAPREQMSGMGKAVSFKRCGRDGRVQIKRVSVEGAEEAWALSATPAESVLIGLELIGRRPDVVVSGVNVGANIGLEDLLTSGTVGAAMEAAIHGILGVAVSLDHDSLEPPEYYERAARIGARVAKEFLEIYDGSYDLVNVNIPTNPRGIALTRLSLNSYVIKLRASGDLLEPYDGRDAYEGREGTDAWAVRRGLVSVTPLRISSLADSSDSARNAAATRALSRLSW